MSDVMTPLPEKSQNGGWEPSPETAPSILRQDEPGFARFLGLAGAALTGIGGAALLINRFYHPSALGSDWGTFFLVIGLAGLLFHAAFDFELQYRFIYTIFGFLAFVVGAFLCFFPYPNAVGDQFGLGFMCLCLALLFEMAVLRNEDDPFTRTLIQRFLLVAGSLMAVVGLIGGNVRSDFLLPFGLLLAILGLVYLVAFMSTRGIDSDISYNTGVGMAAAGTLTFLIALGRSIYPTVLHWFQKSGPAAPEYLIPAGFILAAVGAVYLFTAVGLISDNQYVVLVCRELGAFFFSPVAYIILLAYAFAHWLVYYMSLLMLFKSNQPVIEPIVSSFILQWPTIVATVIVVPVLTMRLLSEEHRSGTFEVLVTAPVSEVSVTLSKFIAALIMFLVTWIPFGLLLIALRVIGDRPFDYRPVLSFFVGLFFTGAAFISIGLFFSSLTKSQVGSGVLTFISMLLLTLIFLLYRMVGDRMGESSGWTVLLRHISYISVWLDTLDGRLIPMYLICQASLTVFFLFLTVKVLESRKWA